MHPQHAEYFVMLKQRLEAAPHGQRGQLARAAADFLSCTPATVYRKLEKVGWDSGRKTRTDRGALCVDEQLARTVGGMKKITTRDNGKRTLPIGTIVEILEENGMGVTDAAGNITMPHAATISRAMRVYGCHPDQVEAGTPAVEMRSLHPNHVWQMDASVCVIFYLPGGKVAVMDEKKYNEKKPHNLVRLDKEKQRVIRWLITDHASGSFYLQYTQGTEDAVTAIDVLINALCPRGGNDIMRGAPLILYTDPGSANRANMTKMFCKRLGITPLPHQAGNARATGQVEVTQNIVECHFEGRLRMLAVAGLAELNAHAAAWRIAFHAQKIHSRHGMTRDKAWMTITGEQLRVPHSVEALRAIVGSPPELKKVNAKLILNYTPKGFKALTYSLRHIDGIHIGGFVGVSVNPYLAPAVDVIVVEQDGAERIYTLQPIERDRFNFDVNAPVFGESYASHADTATDKAIKAMDKEAYGVNTLEEAAKARAKKAQAYAHINVMADVQAARTPTYIPKRGRDLSLETNSRELPRLSHVEAAMQLRPRVIALGIEWTSDHLDYLKTTHPDYVPGEAIDGLYAHFAAAAAPAQTPDAAPALRLAVGG